MHTQPRIKVHTEFYVPTFFKHIFKHTNLPNTLEILLEQYRKPFHWLSSSQLAHTFMRLQLPLTVVKVIYGC